MHLTKCLLGRNIPQSIAATSLSEATDEIQDDAQNKFYVDAGDMTTSNDGRNKNLTASP